MLDDGVWSRILFLGLGFWEIILGTVSNIPAPGFEQLRFTGLYYVRRSCICLWDCFRLGLQPMLLCCVYGFVLGTHDFSASIAHRELDAACMF